LLLLGLLDPLLGSSTRRLLAVSLPLALSHASCKRVFSSHGSLDRGGVGWVQYQGRGDQSYGLALRCWAIAGAGGRDQALTCRLEMDPPAPSNSFFKL